MGYTTEFKGKFKLNKKLDDDTASFLTKLANTRRMKRKLPKEYGIEGEFFVDGGGFMGKDHEESVLDSNQPPKSQPGLWCKWIPTEDGKGIEWNGAEKFYEYVPWIKYLIKKILAPKGYVLNGKVKFKGEDRDDKGYIVIEDNIVSVLDRLPNNAEKFIKSI